MQPYSVLAFLELNFTEFSGTFSEVNMHKITSLGYLTLINKITAGIEEKNNVGNIFSIL